MATARVRAAHRPVDAITRANIVKTAKAGKKSRNALAREFSVSGETVTRICAEAGITFDRTMTEAAVRAHSLDVAEERQSLVRQMMAEATEQLDLLNAPYLVYSFGGMDGGIHAHLLDSAPMDIRNIAMRSAGIAFDKASKALEKSTTGVERAESLVDHLEQFFDKVDAEAEAEDDAAAGE